MLKRIRAIYRRARKPFDRLWEWADGHGTTRWKALKRWSAQRLRRAKQREAQVAFWTKKHTIYRRKYRAALKRQRERKKPKWEPWMANGRNANVNAAVKREVAIAVVKFGCAVSSLYRATVIPQSNPNSYHGPNVNPGKAGDLVGGGMLAYQRDFYKRRKGDPRALELFGPANSLWLKNGQPTSGAEGSFLEQLHDSHTHIAVTP
jgi:hypothetical protein